MANRELLEWLGITVADMFVYLVTGLIVAMFFVSNSIVDAILAGSAVVIAIAACPIGMRRDPEVSPFTNVVKLLAYPFCVLLAAGAIVVHHVWFNR